MDKKNKADRLQKVLAKRKQNDITSFFEVDPYCTKAVQFDENREFLDKNYKGKNQGINNHKSNAAR